MGSVYFTGWTLGEIFEHDPSLFLGPIFLTALALLA